MAGVYGGRDGANLGDSGEFAGKAEDARANSMIARFGDFVLDGAQRTLLRRGLALHLTPKAFDLLVLLIAAAPRVVPKAELRQRLWSGTFVTEATVTGVVKEIRRALDDGSVTSFIRTAHGVGYAFAATVDPAAPAAAPPTAPPAAHQARHWVVESGRSVMLWPGENLIGREPSATVSIDLSGVSRRHARLTVVGEHATIEDLSSKNGTRVGDRSVTAAVALHDGDAIHIGPAVLVYRVSVGEESTATHVG